MKKNKILKVLMGVTMSMAMLAVGGFAGINDALLKNYDNSGNSQTVSAAGSTLDTSTLADSAGFDGSVTIGADLSRLPQTADEDGPNYVSPEQSWQGTISYTTLTDLYFNLQSGDGNFFKHVGQGVGTEESPYMLQTASDIAFLSKTITAMGANLNSQTITNPENAADTVEIDLRNKHFKLGEDIHFGNYVLDPIADLDFSTNLNMYFDGNGKTIYSAHVSVFGKASDTASHASIFGSWPGGHIKNLVLSDCYVESDRRAAIVSITGDSALPTEFIDITLDNCKVLSKRESYGISDSATCINNCRVENCTITVSDDSEAVYGASTSYAFGFGITNEVENADLSSYGLFNSEVSIKNTYDDYDITANRTKTFYVGGIARNLSTGLATYSSFNIKDSRVFTDSNVVDCNYNLTDVHYALGINSYVVGAVYSNVNTEIANAVVDNSEIMAKMTFAPTDTTKNRGIIPGATNYVSGLAYINCGYDPVLYTDYVYDNVVINKATVKSNIDIKMNVANYNPSTAYSSTRTIGMGSYVAGVTYLPTNGQRFRNVNVIDCEIEGYNKYDDVEDTSYCPSSTIVTYGVGGSSSFANSAKYYACSVNNSIVSANGDIQSRRHTGDDDYYNSVTNYTSAIGIGRGSFYNAEINSVDTNTSITGSYLTGTSKTTKDPSDTRGSVSAYSQVVGVGFPASSEYKNVVVDNCKLISDCNRGTAYAIGMGFNNGSGNAPSLLFDNSTVKNTTLSAVGFVSNAIGMSYNTQAIAAGGQYTIKNCTINNVNLSVDGNVYKSSNSTQSAMGLFYAVSSAVNIIDTTVQDSVITAESDYAYNYAIGFGHSSSSYYGATYTNCSALRNEIYSNHTGIGSSYSTYAVAMASGAVSAMTNCLIDGGLLNTYNAQHNAFAVGLSFNIATTTSVEFTDNTINGIEVVSKSRNLTFASAGIYSERTYSEGLTINGCVVSDATILADSTEYSATSTTYACGLIYDTSNTVIVNDSIVKDSDITARGNSYTVNASGMGIHTSSSRLAYYDNCYTDDNQVLAEFVNNGNGGSYNVCATGLANYYVKNIKNSVVGNGSVIARNAVGESTAYGIAAMYGTSIVNQVRPGNCSVDPYTSLESCYNYSSVLADSPIMGYAGGIAHAEEIDSCVNAGSVTGNYAGGITPGHYYSYSSTNVRYSAPLIIRNSINTANIYRNNQGGTPSYIGGLVGLYYSPSSSGARAFVLENNISLGGIYNSPDGDLQRTTSGVYMGMLYGFLYLGSDVSAFDRGLGSSFNGNYILCSPNVNAGLYRPEVSESIVAFSDNTPRSYYLSSADGVYYSTSNTNTNIQRYKELYSNCATAGGTLTTNTNKYIESYSTDTFNLDETEDADLIEFLGETRKVWNVSTADATPQIENNFTKQVLTYRVYKEDRTFIDVIILDKSDENVCSAFTTPNATVVDVGTGRQIGNWADGSTTLAAGSMIDDLATKNFVYDMLGTIVYTTYTLRFTDNAQSSSQMFIVEGIEIEDSATDPATVTLETSSIVLSTIYNDTGLQAVEWYVYNGTVNTTLSIFSTNNNTNSLDITSLFTSAFIEQNAVGNVITFTVNYIIVETHDITIQNSISGESADNYTVSIVTGGANILNETTATVIAGHSDITVTVTPIEHYILQVITISPNVSGWDSANLSNTIPAGANTDYTITIEVVKKQYEVFVEIQNLQSLVLPVSVDTLIENNSETITVDGIIPQIQAKTNISGYRFIGWKLRGMTEYLAMSSTAGELASTNSIDSTDLSRYIIPKNLEGVIVEMFEIIAVFQRQYALNIELNNPESEDEDLKSYFVLQYTDSEGVNQSIELSNEQIYTGDDEEGSPVYKTIRTESGSYMLDENTMVMIDIKVNKRVILDSVLPDTTLGSGNLYFVSMDQDKNISISFTAKSTCSVVYRLIDQNGNVIIDAGITDLITSTDLNIVPAGEDIEMPAAVAKSLYVNEEDGYGYKFMNWARGETQLVSEVPEGTSEFRITAGQTMTEDAFFTYVGEGTTFELTAKFQRIFKLTINADIPVANEVPLPSQYTITFGRDTTAAHTGELSVWINESGLAQIDISVNARTTIDEEGSTLDGATLAGNSLFITMSSAKAIVVRFAVKSTYFVTYILVDQNGNVITDAETTDLITSTGLNIVPAGEDIEMPAAVAKALYTNEEDGFGYRFLNWARGETQLASATQTITAGQTMTEDTFFTYVGEGTTFELTAKFQRIFNLNVAMGAIYIGEESDDELGAPYNVEAFESEYCITNNGNTFTGEETSVWFDQGELVKIDVKPNVRVAIKAPEDIEFGNNTAYIIMSADKTIIFDSYVRKLNISGQALEIKEPQTLTAIDNLEGLYINRLNTSVLWDVDDNMPSTLELGDVVSLEISSDLTNLSYRGLGFYLKNVETEKLDSVAEFTIDNDFYDEYVAQDGNIIVYMTVIKRHSVAITSNKNSAGEYVLGEYTLTFLDEGNNVITDITNNERVQQVTENASYIVDNGIKIRVTPTASSYCLLSGYSGLFGNEAQPTYAEIVANDNRSVAVTFEKEVFTLDVTANAEASGELVFTETFSIGDTISISYTPANNYVITDWAINNKALENFGAIKTGNTVTMVATKTFLDALNEEEILVGGTLTLTSQISTMMSPTLFYGLIGGSAALVVMIALVLFLVIRSQKLKKQKEENERQLNDIKRKFNIGDMIKDLKSGKGTGVPKA